MATRQQAERQLGKLGFTLDPDSGRAPNMGHNATIDPARRMSISGDCRGDVIFDYTAPASAFWQEVIDRAKELAPYLDDCPHPEGECDYHDPEDCCP